MDLHSSPSYNETLSQRELSFNEGYKKYAAGVYSNIYKLVRDQKVCEDLLQEVFIAFWNHLDSLDENQNIGGWLFVVSHNKAKTYLKNRLKEAVLLYGDLPSAFSEWEDEATDDAVYEEQCEMINKALDSLSSQKRLIFIMNKYEGISVDEIASQMQLKRQTVVEYLKQTVQYIRQFVLHHQESLSKTTLLLLTELMIGLS